MLTESAAGVFPISATPFKPDGALDLASLDGLTEFYLERGATGLTILGIMAAKTMNRSGYDVRMEAGSITAGAIGCGK